MRAFYDTLKHYITNPLNPSNTFKGFFKIMKISVMEDLLFWNAPKKVTKKGG